MPRFSYVDDAMIRKKRVGGFVHPDGPQTPTSPYRYIDKASSKPAAQSNAP